MDRQLLIASTLCFFTALVRTLLAARDRTSLHGRVNFFAIGLGFLFQTAFLSVRGHALGRCPLTNLFEVFVFLAWSVALIYLLIGPAYRLSLMGAFTAPLIFAVQTFALAAPIVPLCRPECEGLCPLCGADRSLGPHAHPDVPIDPRLDVLRDFHPGAEA